VSHFCKHLGSSGELAAQVYLRGLGYKIIEKNFKCKIGEIDIIARDGNTLVFIEVKTRSSFTFGLPEEAVTARKIHKIHLIGDYYRSLHKELPELTRIDVIAVEPPKGQIRLLRNVTG